MDDDAAGSLKVELTCPTCRRQFTAMFERQQLQQALVVQCPDCGQPIRLAPDDEE